ncbi:uncharacterized protein LOC129309219 [Prosopis cineraria]|uniref:uncharacterized protein LOC129309219 n=1 Tax=Prosopis cineraria TaxID=364024 RepID=UPI00240F735E|nr:uncharacterized protein LOC129309219 [Prosopis cineraria]XP_054806637.1 uncharacterized protein LOC129309219 [Prosopis cineraria]XP_054806638.1 uncharacterized protein LOC129309219 [Prosopis cineraria]
MEQEGKDTENPPDVSSTPELLEKDDNRKDAESSEKNHGKKDAESSEKDDCKKDAESSDMDNNTKDAESSEKDSSKKDVESSEKDSSKKGAESSEKVNKMSDEEIAPEGTSEPDSSDKNTSQQLKVQPRTVKKSPAGRFKTKKTKGALGDTGNMEQQESRKDAEKSSDVSFRSESLENVNSKKDAELSEKDNSKDAESSEVDNSKKDVQSSEKDNSKKDACSSEKDNSKKDTESSKKDNKMKDAEITPEGTSKPGSCDKITPQQLKARPKILKKSPAARSKTRKTKGAQGDTGNVEQEESRKDAGNSPDVSFKSESSENVNSKKDSELLEKDNSKDAESSEKDNSKKDAESSEKDNSKMDAFLSETDDSKKDACSSEKDNSKKDTESSKKDNKMKDAEITPEGTSKPGSCDKITPQQLKARPKILKKSPAARSKTRKTKGAQGDTGNVEQEESRKDAENSPDVSFKSESSENVNSKKDSELLEKDNSKDAESSEKDNSKKDAESSEKDNSKMDAFLSETDDSKKDAFSSEKDNSKKHIGSLEKDNKMNDAEVIPEGTSNPGSCDKNTPQQLKAQPKILKKSPAARSKTRKNKGAQGDTGNVEQEESRKDAENSPDVSFKFGSSENVNSKKGADSSEKDSMKDAENSSRGSSRPGSSDKNDPQSLKAKPKITKKSLVSGFKTRMSKGVQGETGNMGQEESRKDTENSLNMSPDLSKVDKIKKDTESSETDYIKDAENAPNESNQPEASDKNSPRPLRAKSKIVKKSQVGGSGAKKINGVQGDTTNKEQEERRKDSEHPPNVSSRSEPSDKEKKDAENPPVGSSKIESSDKNTPRSLKANPKIVKKSQASKFKTNKNKVAQKIWEKQRRKNKKLLGNSDKRISQGIGQKRIPDKLPEKSHRDESNKVDRQNRNNGDKMLGKKNKGKHADLTMGAMSKKSKGRDGGIRKIQSNEKNREKLGGLIFMCNAKTKPDCFRYHVMGVSAGKKDVVFGIKPGLKLFLYDFDLKLLYGIYKATSSGGMKLETRAFEGLFPAQVRFSVDKDCYPLPESIFKRAIKENYNEKNKFKTELTVRQVRKLTELFRPLEVHSTLRSARSPPKVIVRDREVRDVARGSRPHSYMERPAREYFANSHVSSYNVLPDERDHRIGRREEVTNRIERREEAPRDLFLTERDYRAYGLQGDRSVVNPPSHVHPRLDRYERDYERDHRQHLGPIYRDNVPVHAETLRPDPPYLDEIKYQAYSRGARLDFANDPYHHAYHHGSSSRDSYIPPPLSREEIRSSSYLTGERTLARAEDLRRRETGQDRRYSTFAAEAVSEYNRTQHYNGSRRENAPIPVSSRYSFAGPSYSYR